MLWRLLLLATLPNSQSHATEAPATAAPSDGPRLGELCQQTHSGDTEAGAHNAEDTRGLRFQHLPAINHSFHIVLGVWAYQECPAGWHEGYRGVLVNLLSKVRSMEGQASRTVPGHILSLPFYSDPLLDNSQEPRVRQTKLTVS